MSPPDFGTIIVSREEVEALDTTPALASLQTLIASPETARRWYQKIDLSIDGYNHIADELFEIPEVRDYVHKLDDAFPFWLYFLSKRHLGLQCIALCFLPPFLTSEAKAKHFPDRLNRLLSNRWFPAMTQICEWTDMTEEQIEDLTDRSVRYLLSGPESEAS